MNEPGVFTLRIGGAPYGEYLVFFKLLAVYVTSSSTRQRRLKNDKFQFMFILLQSGKGHSFVHRWSRVRSRPSVMPISHLDSDRDHGEI